MIMFEQSRRLSEPLRWGRREKTIAAVLISCVVLALAGLGAGFVASTLVHGHPGGLALSRAGRVVLGFAVVVAVANVLLWALRFTGLFGGPVPV